MSSQSSIFEDTQCCTEKQLHDLVAGSLPAEELHAVESHLVDCSFCTDALDGYALVPAVGAVADVNQRIDNLVGEATPGFWQSNKGWMMAAAGLAVIAVAAIAVMNLAGGPEQELVAEQVEKKPLQPREQEWDIEEAAAIPQQEQITAAEVERNRPPTVEENGVVEVAEVEEEMMEDEEAVAMDDPVEEDLAPSPEGTELAEEAEPSASKYARSNVDVGYINELKVVDYSSFYKSTITRLEAVISGTPADQANKDDKPEEELAAFKEVQVPYAEFLKQATEKFQRSDYKGALKDYRTIIDQFPEDVNAHFYGGLCNYNLGKSASAIAWFDVVLNNYINTFDQEAEWYMALSLLQNGEKKEAKALLTTISNSNGFYAVQAREKLAKK